MPSSLSDIFIPWDPVTIEDGVMDFHPETLEDPLTSDGKNFVIGTKQDQFYPLIPTPCIDMIRRVVAYSPTNNFFFLTRYLPQACSRLSSEIVLDPVVGTLHSGVRYNDGRLMEHIRLGCEVRTEAALSSIASAYSRIPVQSFVFLGFTNKVDIPPKLIKDSVYVFVDGSVDWEETTVKRVSELCEKYGVQMTVVSPSDEFVGKYPDVLALSNDQFPPTPYDPFPAISPEIKNLYVEYARME